MGYATGQYFRDKLAMRIRAKSYGISNPNFVSVFNDNDSNDFVDNVLVPWVLKARSDALAARIIKVHNKEDL